MYYVIIFLSFRWILFCLSTLGKEMIPLEPIRPIEKLFDKKKLLEVLPTEQVDQEEEL